MNEQFHGTKVLMAQSDLFLKETEPCYHLNHSDQIKLNVKSTRISSWKTNQLIFNVILNYHGSIMIIYIESFFLLNMIFIHELFNESYLIDYEILESCWWWIRSDFYIFSSELFTMNINQSRGSMFNLISQSKYQPKIWAHGMIIMITHHSRWIDWTKGSDINLTGNWSWFTCNKLIS